MKNRWLASKQRRLGVGAMVLAAFAGTLGTQTTPLHSGSARAFAGDLVAQSLGVARAVAPRNPTGTQLDGTVGPHSQHGRAMEASGLLSGVACGPPAYCSRTDLLTVQLPPPPNVGNLRGANIVVTDPNFLNRIVRITDAYTDPTHFNFTYVTTGGSADENIWNLNSTLFKVDNTGKLTYPFSFDPVLMQASRLYSANFPETDGLVLSGGGEWSHSNANLLYINDPSGLPIIDSVDFTDRTVPPTPQLVFDFTSGPNCLPSTFKSAQAWKAMGRTSADDSVFGMTYSNSGGQGTAVYAVAYKVGAGCRWFNTQTGQVGGDWGTSGAVPIPDRFTIHNVKLSEDGNWMIVVPENCLTTCTGEPYFWQIGANSVRVCLTGELCAGHWTEGYTHWVNNATSPKQVSQSIRPFSNLAGNSELISSYPTGLRFPWDTHQSWNNVDPADSLPMFQSTWSTVRPFPTAWYNEIQGVATDGSGKVWRFAHNFITGRSHRFTATYGIGSVSQDGKFFIFSSDWLGQLGSESGTTTCTVGKDCRGDVFVVELK